MAVNRMPTVVTLSWTFDCQLFWIADKKRQIYDQFGYEGLQEHTNGTGRASQECRRHPPGKYSNHLNSRQVWHLNSPNMSGCQMVRFWMVVWKVQYLNGPPTHMVRPSEYWKKSVWKVVCSDFGCLVFRWLMYTNFVLLLDLPQSLLCIRLITLLCKLYNTAGI